jgi:DNA-binding XRE family transcriptional regulator
MKDMKKEECSLCSGRMVPRPFIRDTKIGRYTAQDPRRVQPTCESCGDVLVSARHLREYGLSAAVAVLRDPVDVAGPEARAVRKILGLTQAELADVLGIAAETVSRAETSDKELPRTTRLAMADIAAMELDKLREAVSPFVRVDEVLENTPETPKSAA